MIPARSFQLNSRRLVLLVIPFLFVILLKKIPIGDQAQFARQLVAFAMP